MRLRRIPRLGGFGVVVLLLLVFALDRFELPPAPAPETPATESATSAVESAFAERRSDVWLGAAGEVERTLADDLDGSRHQRFVLRLESGHTVLVSHNIDLAPRIDALRVGDRVTLRGEYEWNDRGGVIHWTHRDPAGRRAGGWIEHDGRRYR